MEARNIYPAAPRSSRIRAKAGIPEVLGSLAVPVVVVGFVLHKLGWLAKIKSKLQKGKAPAAAAKAAPAPAKKQEPEALKAKPRRDYKLKRDVDPERAAQLRAERAAEAAASLSAGLAEESHEAETPAVSQAESKAEPQGEPQAASGESTAMIQMLKQCVLGALIEVGGVHAWPRGEGEGRMEHTEAATASCANGCMASPLHLHHHAYSTSTP